MTPRDVVFHARAAEDAATIETWWRANRTSAPELFVQELGATLALVVSSPTLGALAAREDDFPGVRRVLMRRTRFTSTTDSLARRSRSSRFGTLRGAKVRRSRSAAKNAEDLRNR